ILLLESTYGNRVHQPHPEEKLIDIIQEAHQDNGTIIIPSFAVERAQLLMYLLWKLRKEKKIPKMPIFLDSPMGIEVLAIFQKYHEWHKLSPAIFVQMSKEITLVNSIQETLELAADKSHKIVIAGSGMATGGRVLTYLEHYLADTKATILLAGYQAEGTRGKALLDGEKQLKMHGKFWEVKAKIRHIDGLSAHADQNELLDWLNEIVPAPAYLFLVHGEMVSALALKEAIFHRFGWKATIPQLNEKASIRVK
ncbi:MAG: MBL fold metallo-hydrolase, partial [Flammeovirgaceae bacterium]|nr:MBL fold metallo-hydrolase [Flammeovirgaceae bacterium]MDW8288528.1 MBL fold metallo-hydrolase RNA specificity domain-containing protein [Flammeovirgaceae bacterium]